MASWQLLEALSSGLPERAASQEDYTWLSSILGAPLLMNCTMALSADIVKSEACPACTHASSGLAHLSVRMSEELFSRLFIVEMTFIWQRVHLQGCGGGDPACA